jgi:hypothetical protein
VGLQEVEAPRISRQSAHDSKKKPYLEFVSLGEVSTDRCSEPHRFVYFSLVCRIYISLFTLVPPWNCCGVTWSSRFELPRSLRGGSTAAHMLGLWVRIPPVAWIFVYFKCCVLCSRGLSEGLITCSEESYRVWCVWVWSRSPIRGGGALPGIGSNYRKKKSLK